MTYERMLDAHMKRQNTNMHKAVAGKISELSIGFIGCNKDVDIVSLALLHNPRRRPLHESMIWWVWIPIHDSTV
jgi:hypothetical protein